MTKITDLLDGQAIRELRLLLFTRFSWIDRVHPETGSLFRATDLENLNHLIHELGWRPEDFK